MITTPISEKDDPQGFAAAEFAINLAQTPSDQLTLKVFKQPVFSISEMDQTADYTLLVIDAMVEDRHGRLSHRSFVVNTTAFISKFQEECNKAKS